VISLKYRVHLNDFFSFPVERFSVDRAEDFAESLALDLKDNGFNLFTAAGVRTTREQDHFQAYVQRKTLCYVPVPTKMDDSTCPLDSLEF
jgi:hypothetical protein